MNVTIRDATADDLEEVLDMVRGLADFEGMADEVRFDPAAMREHLFGPDPVAHVAIADIDGAVAGMALWYRTLATYRGKAGIWLEDLFVRPHHRGSGVGEALVRYLLGRGGGWLRTSALDWNLAAIGFYQHLGAVAPDPGGSIQLTWSPP